MPITHKGLTEQLLVEREDATKLREQNAKLVAALDRARSHIVTLGGGYNGQAYGDAIHQAVLEQIDETLANQQECARINDHKRCPRR